MTVADSALSTTLYFVAFYFFTVTFMLNLVLAIYIDSCVRSWGRLCRAPAPHAVCRCHAGTRLPRTKHGHRSKCG